MSIWKYISDEKQWDRCIICSSVGEFDNLVVPVGPHRTPFCIHCMHSGYWVEAFAAIDSLYEKGKT